MAMPEATTVRVKKKISTWCSIKKTDEGRALNAGQLRVTGENLRHCSDLNNSFVAEGQEN
jgi:hypothetical protein